MIGEYEKNLEDAFAQDTRKKPEIADKNKQKVATMAKHALDLRKSKCVTFRLTQSDLIRLKARAQEINIPYQTHLTTLIRDFVDGVYSVKL